MSLDQKLRKELSMGGSSNLGGFLGGWGERGGSEKSVLCKKKIHSYGIILSEKVKHITYMCVQSLSIKYLQA